MIEHFFVQRTAGMIKMARRVGTEEKYLPWYGSTALGGIGAMTAQNYVPAKYKLPAAVGGSLVGTAMGVHGGEAVGRWLDKRRRRKAEREKTGEQKRPRSIPGIVGEGLLGLGAGTLAGYGIGRGLEALARPAGVPVSHLFPRVGAVGGALVGTAYPLWKAYETADIQKALMDRRAQLDATRAARQAGK